jgi:GNAT superfamily N-acetyltransferase
MALESNAQPIQHGSCHCGAVRFEVDGRPEGLEECNCSLCRRAGTVQWYVPDARFRLLCGGDVLRDYQFGTHTSHNLFCSRCGTAPFRRPRSDPERIAVNVRCLEDARALDLPRRRFDGENWEQAMASRSGPDARFAPGRMRVDELEPVVRLWMRTKLETAPWSRLATERGYSFEQNLAYFRDELVEKGDVWVVRQADRPIGFLVQAGTQVEQLFVDPSQQGRGVGTALLAKARECSPARLCLFALADNHRACRFYERHGFRVVRRGTSPPPESEPDVLYEWTPSGA